MTMEPIVSQQVKSANKFLWAVQCYLDLISGTTLSAGDGLKRLFVMSSGVATLNDDDIEAITAKSERLKILPNNLNDFLTSSVLKNIQLYGLELKSIIYRRTMAISTGEVRNPDPLFKFSAEEARRYYYLPPAPLMLRLEKALIQDHGFRGNRMLPVVVSLEEVAQDATTILSTMQITEGHLTPTESSWGALAQCVEKLTALLELEANYPVSDRDYKIRARPALKILWMIAKLLMGDLGIQPERKDLNRVDLQQKLNMSDGTLAAIPFPLPQTVSLFEDRDKQGVTMKGRLYLGAISAAAFYRGDSEEV